jgi:YHS domain-containing protein
MTLARPKRKQFPNWWLALASFALALSGGVQLSRAATTELIVVDWHTGLAIGGYDPVAFFTDGAPKLGNAAFELRYGGAVWRFCNSGNRDAFASRPDVYTPQYGGYDPLGVAHGVAVAGNPIVWFVAEQRLFLFYDAVRRDKFAADSDPLILAAMRKWPDLLRTLSP